MVNDLSGRVGVWYLVANSGDDGEVLPDEVNITIDESGGEPGSETDGAAADCRGPI